MQHHVNCLKSYGVKPWLLLWLSWRERILSRASRKEETLFPDRDGRDAEAVLCLRNSGLCSDQQMGFG